jgi:hypothetical protein
MSIVLRDKPEGNVDVDVTSSHALRHRKGTSASSADLMAMTMLAVALDAAEHRDACDAWLLRTHPL